MRASHAAGVISRSRQPGCFCIDGAPWFAVAVGVAEKPDARPPVIASEGTSRNFKRWPDFVVQGFQVSHHRVEFGAVEASNVLTNDPSRPEFGNNSAHLRPEPTM